MDDSEKHSDLDQVNGLSLIDVTSEDDSLLLKSPLRDPLDHRSSENHEHSNATNVEGSTDTFEQNDRVPQLFESPEPERTVKNGKYNLRKSLAWDSAFFTNAGVLDPEELSCMMGGVEKGGKTLLPGIQEDIQRSTESLSSLESDNLTLESLEADLFDDIRASIQKSSKLSKATNSCNSSGSRAAETQTIPSSKMDLASQSKTPKPTSKKPLLCKIGSGKTTKLLSACPETPKRATSSVVATLSAPKPPKVLGSASPMSSLTPKRASLGAERLRKEVDNAQGLTGRGTLVSKTSAIGGSRSNAPRPVPIRSSKSSTLSSSIATKIDPRSSCSSFGSSGSASSDNISIASLNSTKRKVGPRTANVPSSGLTRKPLSRPKCQNPSGTSQLSAHLKAFTKPSSNISPASSISDWSSESSISTSTANQRSNSSRTSLDSNKEFPIESDVSSGSHSNGLGPASSCNGTQATGMLGRGIRKALTGTNTYPASGKPSGLRLPSPKIGFFDGAKSLVRTPNGSTQSSPAGVLHRVEAGHASPHGNTSKGNTGKFQPARPVAVKGNTRLDTQQMALGTKLKSPTPQEPSTASRSAASSPAMSHKVQNKMSPKTNGENHLKPVQVEAKEPDMAMHANLEVSLSAEDGNKLNSSTHQEPSHGCMKTQNACGNESSLPAIIHKDQNDTSLKSNGENHMKAEEVAAKEPDVTHSRKLSSIVQDSNNGSLKDEVSAETRVPLAVRDSFCNRDGSCDDDTVSSAEVEAKTAIFSVPEGKKMENS